MDDFMPAGGFPPNGSSVGATFAEAAVPIKVTATAIETIESRNFILSFF